MSTAPWPDRPSGPIRGERGVGLMEVIVATVIAIIAILALAYTFGMGRGLIGRFETARVAFAAAQRRMETLSAAPLTSPDLRIPVLPSYTYGPDPVQVDGRTVAYESWTVEAWTTRVTAPTPAPSSTSSASPFG